MALTLALSAEVPAIQAWRPLYLILTVIIVCSQKVDTTLSKGVLRLVASVVGGAYGNLLLPWPTLVSVLNSGPRTSLLVASAVVGPYGKACCYGCLHLSVSNLGSYS